MKKSLLVILTLVFNLFLFAAVFGQEQPVSVSFESKKISDKEYDIIFKTTIEDGWHMYSLYHNPDCDDPKKDLICPQSTEITFNKSADYELVGKPTESKPVEEFDKVFEMKVFYFEHGATFKQRIKVKS
ncbi:MAG: sugar transporter [Bacteroidia bacterium]